MRSGILLARRTPAWCRVSRRPGGSAVDHRTDATNLPRVARAGRGVSRRHDLVEAIAVVGQRDGLQRSHAHATLVRHEPSLDAAQTDDDRLPSTEDRLAETTAEHADVRDGRLPRRGRPAQRAGPRLLHRVIESHCAVLEARGRTSNDRNDEGAIRRATATPMSPGGPTIFARECTQNGSALRRRSARNARDHRRRPACARPHAQRFATSPPCAVPSSAASDPSARGAAASDHVRFDHTSVSARA